MRSVSRIVQAKKPMPGETVIDRSGIESVVLSTGMKYLNVREVGTGLCHLVKITECTTKLAEPVAAPTPPVSIDDEFNS
jgi:hypothetical protein